MIDASLLEFAKTGQLGPLHAGMTRDELAQQLGLPETWSAPSRREHASIWKYGDVEFHFQGHRVFLIFCDHGSLTSGGATLRLDPWIIRVGMDRSSFECELSRIGIEFDVREPPALADQRRVVTRSGANFGFIDESGDEFDAPGLFAWHGPRLDL
jgi:hypothetical protein